MQKSIVKDKFPAECQNKTKNRHDTYNHTGVFPDLDYHYYIEESFAVGATTKPFTQSEYRYAVEKQGLTYQEPSQVWDVHAVRFKLPDTKEEREALKPKVAMSEVAIRQTLDEIHNMPNKERHKLRETLKRVQSATRLDLSDLNQDNQGQER